MRAWAFSGICRQALRVRLALLAFIAATVLYGLFGFPTPASFGIVEASIGFLLLFAIGPAGAARLFTARQPCGWALAAQGLALYGLTVPVLGGLLNGADPALMLRDLIPFLFLLLPFFLQPLARRLDAPERRAVTAGIVFSGLCFAARVVGPWFRRGANWHPAMPADPDYLANAPTVLFAALLLSGMAGRELYAGLSARRMGRAAVFAGMAAMPAIATMLVTQRASAGALAVFLTAGFMAALWRSPVRALVLAVAAAALFAWHEGGILSVAQGMLAKTQAVGVNMRGQEALAVLKALGPSPLGVLFGRGWGATVASPAVGGLTVNYTHNFLTTYWLKTGLCGAALAVLYIGSLARLLLRFPVQDGVLAAALALPLLIDVTLYASFKSLDFGLVLFLLTLRAPAEQPQPLPILAMRRKTLPAHAAG